MKTRKNLNCTLLAVACLMLLALAKPSPVYGAVYRTLTQGNAVTAYPLATGKITVYDDSGCETRLDTLKGKSLTVTLKKYRDHAFYGTYKTDEGKESGWFREKDFVKQPSYEHEFAAARYSTTAYNRKSGSAFGSIISLSSIETIGKSGSWYQIIFQSKYGYRIGWIRESTHKYIRRYYDSREKKLLAEGTYYLSPKSSLSRRVRGSSSKSLALKKTDGDTSEKFKLRFVGNNCYTVSHAQTGLYLTASVAENGKYTGQADLEPARDPGDQGQLWQLARSGDYFSLKNVGSKRYLAAAKGFTLSKKATASETLFKFTIATLKNRRDYQVFSQYDPDWGRHKYGRSGILASSACGILSLTNAVYALNGQFADPVKLADYAVRVGYRVPNHGTSTGFFRGAAKKFGRTYGFAYAGSTYSLTTLKRHLQKGGTAIGHVPGHYIAIGDYKNGKYLVLDCYAAAKRHTTPYGDWVSGSRLQSGGLRSKAFYLIKKG